MQTTAVPATDSAPPLDPDTLRKAFAIIEQGEADEKGWDTEPTLYTYARQDEVQHITVINPLEWTCYIRGVLGAPDATGDLAHDLALYASRSQPLPGFVAVFLIYHTDADPTEGTREARVLIAVDERGNAYRIRRELGQAEAPAELVYLDADDYLLTLNRLADVLRGGKPVHEYAFDVRLFAVARVKATSEAEARQAVASFQSIDVNYSEDGVTVTEVSTDDGEPDLIEIDGREPH